MSYNFGLREYISIYVLYNRLLKNVVIYIAYSY